MLTLAATAIGVVLGAVIGSFIGCAVYRHARGLSVRHPQHSFCPACKRRLTWPDLIPMLSYLVWRGRCRTCHTPFSAHYFWLELVTALWGGLCGLLTTTQPGFGAWPIFLFGVGAWGLYRFGLARWPAPPSRDI